MLLHSQYIPFFSPAFHLCSQSNTTAKAICPFTLGIAVIASGPLLCQIQPSLGLPYCFVIFFLPSSLILFCFTFGCLSSSLGSFPSTSDTKILLPHPSSSPYCLSKQSPVLRWCLWRFFFPIALKALLGLWRYFSSMPDCGWLLCRFVEGMRRNFGVAEKGWWLYLNGGGLGSKRAGWLSCP